MPASLKNFQYCDVDNEEQQPSAMEIELFKDQSAKDHSSTVLVIPDAVSSHLAADSPFHSLAQGFNVVVVGGYAPKPNEIFKYTETLAARLERDAVKRVTAFGIGSGGHVAQALAVFDPKLVRRIVLVDSTTKRRPDGIMAFVESLERKLPLGFPLRVMSDDFDSRPFLHRIHCPTLIAVSPNADAHVKSEGEYLSKHVPNAWLSGLAEPITNGSQTVSHEFQKLLKNFLQVATKRPQKNV